MHTFKPTRLTAALRARGRLGIVDQDFNTDPGDVGQAAAVMMSHQLGYVRLIGAILGTSAPSVVGVWDAIRKWYGLTPIPLGVWKGAAIDSTDSGWLATLYRSMSRDVGLASTVEDSTTAYRRMLATSPDGSVEIFAGGYANTLDALLSSGPDRISTLTGKQLIFRKVKMLWWSAGEYPTATDGEYNMRGGTASNPTYSAMSHRVCTTWPSPITYSGFVFGQYPLVEGSLLHSTKNSADPRRVSYDSFNGGTDNGGWDAQVIISALDQAGLSFVYGSNTSVDTSTGINTWVDNVNGKDRYLVKTNSTESWYKDRIEAMSCTDPGTGRNIPQPSWGSSTPIPLPSNRYAPRTRPPKTPYLGELIGNSCFANNSLSGWTFLNTTGYAVNDRMTCSDSSSYPIAAYTVSTTPGVVYRCRSSCTYNSAGPQGAGQELTVFIKDGADLYQPVNTSASGVTTIDGGPGEFDFTFTASTSQSTFFIIQNSGNTNPFTLDRASIVPN